ncbi:MAG: hypothetical protein AVDCRST_MAG93-1509, partial [uncultured Chloroflexia bacterium]
CPGGLRSLLSRVVRSERGARFYLEGPNGWHSSAGAIC